MSRPPNLSAAEALERLKEGNLRYVNDRVTGERRDSARRAELTKGQWPFVTIVSCADSRVSPELMFDEGLGDLFVIRVAGNINTPEVLGSIEYASLNLGVNLVVVMGHQSCGAVTAAVQNVDATGPVTNTSIDSLIDAIRPSVVEARKDGEDDLTDRSIRVNAQLNAESIGSDEAAMEGLAELGSRVIPAYYSLDSGEVSFL